LEVRDHLRRAASDIHNRNVRVREPGDDPIDRLTLHDFSALRAGVDVAMIARQVAQLADVDLQNFGLCMAKLNSAFSECLLKTIHYRCRSTNVAWLQFQQPVCAQIDKNP
jgi:hypothetical protein